MNLLSDVITYIRRIIKSPSNSQITDNLIIDYINRFWIMDVDARIQLFDLKTKYQFQTTPGIDQYNMPLYNVQTEGTAPATNINFYPVYQGFTGSARVNGITTPFYTQQSDFFALWSNYVQQVVQVATGDGGSTYSINMPFFPLLPGHVDISGIVATGVNEDPPIADTLNTSIPYTSIYPSFYLTATGSDGQNIVVQDSGQFLETNTTGDLYGLLMTNGTAPFGYSALSGNTYSTTQNTINYATGEVNVTFQTSIPAGTPINAQVYCINPGLPRAILFFNNVLTFRNPPDKQYLVELEAYLSPAAFMNTSSAIQFAYMAEYIARGAARKILADTGDVEQFMFYEPLFREQESLVWKRSQRQFTSTRTQTIFSSNGISGNYNQYSTGV